MRKATSVVVLVVASLFMAASVAEAQSTRATTTKSGYVACLSLEKFREQMDLSISGDRQAWTRFMENRLNGCVVLRAGVRVHWRGVSGWRNIGIIQIRPAGETVWFYTNTEAVRK